MSVADKWQYGWIHMFMMNLCRDTALEWYQKAVDDGPGTDPDEYSIACMQRIWMYFLLKRGDEIIAECREKAKNSPDDSVQTDNLLIALIYAEKYDEAYEIFSSAKEKFRDNWHWLSTEVKYVSISGDMTRLKPVSELREKSEHISAMTLTASQLFTRKRANMIRLANVI